MSKIERVGKNNEIFAIVVRKGENSQGFRVFTPKEFPLQLGINKKNAGDHSTIHVHTPIETPRHEIIHILKGKARLNVYTKDGRFIDNKELKEGDTALLTEGHGLEFLEDTEILEIKQGPYPEKPEDDKLYLEEP
jgi:uncharacterized protein YjlB